MDVEYISFAVAAPTGKKVKVVLDGWSLEAPAQDDVCIHFEW